MQKQDEFLIKLGERINLLRTSRKLTLEGLCYPNGLEPSTVMRIEKAQTEAKITTLRKLAQAFNLSLSELLDFSI